MSSGSVDAVCDLMAENGDMKEFLLRVLPALEQRCKHLEGSIMGNGDERRKLEGFIAEIKKFTKDFVL